MALLFASPFMVRTKATRSHVYTFDAMDTFSATVTLQYAIGRQSSVSFSVIRDTTPPTLTLEAVVQGTDVHVTWSATDPSPGSGLDASKCLLKVREDDEETWQTFSTLCEGEDATYDGEPGHTYTFRLSAGDNVGNADSLEVQAVVPYVTKYYYANGQRVAMWQGDVVYYIHTDHLGSTSVLSDESGQPAGERVAYLPYGGVRLGDASTLPTDYGFTGQRLEAGLGLMHYGARFYSPRLGRFVSADTIIPNPLNPQDFNRYTYGRNNPLAYIDADGHFPVLVLVALGVTAASIAFFRTPACAGEGCAPGTSSSSPEYQVRSYVTAAETAVEVYFGAELLAGQLLAETWQDEDRGQKEAAEEVAEGAKEAIEQGAKEGTTYRDLLTPDETAEFNRLKQQHSDWMPDLDSPAKVRTPAEVREARRQAKSRGHHRDPLAFGGDPNPEEGTVPTEETRTTKNPIHTTVSGFWNEVLRRIRGERE